MLSWLGNVASVCCRPDPIVRIMNMDDDDNRLDASSLGSLFWGRDLVKHSYGDFSIAVVQANDVIEDHSQVETAKDATFVGIYDGHGGPNASRFVSKHLFHNLFRLALEKGTISEDVLRRAVIATENEFLALVQSTFGTNPLIAAVGTCCLIGVIWEGTLYVANLGDSRAVIGCLGKSKVVVAEQLTKDHNVGLEELREEVRSLYPHDPNIVVEEGGTWRVKGLLQVSRAIGDAFMKQPEYYRNPSINAYYHIPEPFNRPVVTPEPSLNRRILQASDKFIIFASDGLWEFLTNQQAVDIVVQYPRAGIAKKLAERALREAAKKRWMHFNKFMKVPKGKRREFHDDITVVVIFIDPELLEREAFAPELSVSGFSDVVRPSSFSVMEMEEYDSSSSLELIFESVED
ncbi:hypothetical protein SLA2020_128990 [Shorea laevis]